MKTLPIERMIVRRLRAQFNNNKIKVEDIQEWSTAERQIDGNIREDEVKLKVEGVWIAVKKDLDKSK